MAAVRTATMQGAPFSAWEAIDTLFEQAFSRYTTFSPLAASPDLSDRYSNMPPSFPSFPSFPAQKSYQKKFPVPRCKDTRRDSISSSSSSFSSDTSFEDYQKPPPPPRAAFIPSNAAKAPTIASVLEPVLQPKPKPRVSRVRYSEGSETRSAIFSLPRAVNGDVHIGFTPGQLEVKWEYTKTRRAQEGGQVVVRHKQKKYIKIIPLPAGTLFTQIRANLIGRQLTITYPK